MRSLSIPRRRLCVELFLCAGLFVGERAAAAEGAKPIEHGPVQPGAVSEIARRMLARHRLPVEERNLGPGERAAIDECIRLGLAEPDGTLTPAGNELHERIVKPVVPVDALRFDPAYAPKPPKAKKAKPKTRKPEPPAAPMVCECGHGPRGHVNEQARDVRCSGDGGACRCMRYRQAKPAAAEAPAA